MSGEGFNYEPLISKFSKPIVIGKDNHLVKKGNIVFTTPFLPDHLPERYSVINQNPKNNTSSLFVTVFEGNQVVNDSIELFVDQKVIIYFGPLPLIVKSTIQSYLPD